jgi:fructose-1-phosphate kinase PfkB-like protein
MKKILCLCFSPTLQKTVKFNSISVGEVNRSTDYILNASGKGVNTARVLRQLGQTEVTTFCPLGMENYKEFSALSEEDRLNLQYVKIPGKIRECITLLDLSNQTTTEIVISEPGGIDSKRINKIKTNLLNKTLPKLIKSCDALIIAGSHPVAWGNDLYAAICDIAKRFQKIILADFIGQDLLITLNMAVPQIIKINVKEFCSTFNLSLNCSEEELKDAIIKKSEQLNTLIIITRGTQPTFVANCGEFSEHPTIKVLPINTTACGDAFNAGFMSEYINTGNIKNAISKATWAASQNAKSYIPGDIL